MAADPNKLTPKLRAVYMEFQKRCTDKGIRYLLICTIRSKEQQLENIRKGVSWTKNSKHLPGSDGLSRAFDVVPYRLSADGRRKTLLWNSNAPEWQVMGSIGKELGLVWGGDWKQKDMGHFQL